MNANEILLGKPNKGSLAIIKCKDLDIYGRGVANWNNWIVVTPDLIPGEEAKVKFIKKRESRIL